MMVDEELRFIRVADVLQFVPVSETTLYRMIGKGEFPKAKKIGGSSVWPVAQVQQWLRDKAAEEDELI